MKKLLIFILPVMLLAGCAKDLGDYNIDQKNPSAVSAGSLFGNAIRQLSDIQASPSVNTNVFRFWVQQWTTTTYTDEPRYNFTTRNINSNYWNPLYREVLQDLKESKRLTEASADPLVSPATKNNRIAVTEIAAVYTWSVLVNTWGDVPYSEAISDVTKPKYDKAADIYADLFKRLDAAIALITAGPNFGTTDLLYANNTAGWLKFAHSLKMKLALTLADVDAATAQSVITASAAKAFTSNADNAAFKYTTSLPNINPVALNLNAGFTLRQDYIASSTMINMMNTLNDPRRSLYFTTVNDIYVGGVNGGNNTYTDFSRPSDKVTKPEFEALLMDYSEVEFILAEAAARWGIAGSAATHYSNAITASIKYWGGSDDDALVYLVQNKVNYLTATGDYKEKIGTQKYLALYNRGYDAWTEWRRLDYPKLAQASNATSVLPLRLTYPRDERSLNKTNVENASTSIGGDLVATKLFWDKF